MLSPFQETTSHEWIRFQAWFNTWSGQDASQRLAGFGEALTLLRPIVAKAVMRVRRSFALLPDESTCRDGILARLMEMSQLPEQEHLFQIWLESQIVHLVAREREASICSLQSLNPAWQELRRAIHRLPRNDRRTLLHALMPYSVDFPEKEQNQGFVRAKEIWQELIADFPAEAIPESWETEALGIVELPERSSRTSSQSLLISGESESAQRDRFLVGSLAQRLYELAIQTEAKVESSSPLIVDPAILRADEGGNVDFLRRWRDSARPMLLDLGMPDQVMEFLGQLHKAPFGQGEFSADKLLQLSAQLGYSKSNVLFTRGVSALRAGDLKQALVHYESGLKFAHSDKLVATGLANIAGVASAKGNLDETIALMKDAHRICPWARVVGTNRQLLAQLLQLKELDSRGIGF